MMTEFQIINELLTIEHENIASKGKLISRVPRKLTYDLLLDAIKELDNLSRNHDDKSMQKIILMISIIWVYKDPEWHGLDEIIINILSRCGFAPTSKMFYKILDNNKLTSFNSFFNELNILVNQLKFEIKIKNKTLLLSDFQKNIWDKINENNLIGISAPTSAGKSYIILLKAAELLLENKGNIIYIVPTLSLINQVSNDFRKITKEFDITNVIIKNTFEESIAGYQTIYVLTQEKAISAFDQKDVPFSNISMLVVDEIQNLERVGDDSDQRSKLLYDLIIEFRNSINPYRTIIAGPRIEELKQLGIEIFGEKNSEEVNTKVSPVCNITYTISKNDEKYYFKQYCDLLNRPKKILIDNKSIISGYGKVNYNKEYLLYFSDFLNNIGSNQLNIIFSPNPQQAEKISKFLYEKKDLSNLNEKKRLLSEYIKQSISPRYQLSDFVTKGIAFHHGRLPSNIRIVIEKAIKENIVNNVVCTTTLMQGVNLPAQNLFMRNPDLAIKTKNDQKPRLTNYEIANLRGRTGRLMHDLLGRSFIMDESSFDINPEKQAELFEYPTKKIETGYGDAFNNDRKLIIENLESNNELDGLFDTSYIAIYIRQTVLRYGRKCIEKLKTVGIHLTESEYTTIASKLQSLTVPREICLKNRYWDPITLDKIYNCQDFELPQNLYEIDFVDKLYTLIMYIKNKYETYYSKYLRIDSKNDEKYIKHLALLTKDWVTEKSLNSIFKEEYYKDKVEKISDTISEINNKISFGLPRLLKPFYDVKSENSNLLTYFENGINNEVSKKLFSLNIPRETTIFLHEKYFMEKNNYSDDEIIQKLKSIKDYENYWIKIQFEHLV